MSSHGQADEQEKTLTAELQDLMEDSKRQNERVLCPRHDSAPTSVIEISPPFENLNVTIVCDLPPMDAVASGVIDLLQQQALYSQIVDELVKMTGKLPEIGSLVDIESFEDKTLIFLNEFDHPSLAELSMAQFDHLQRALTSARGILWATKGACAECSSHYSNTVQELARKVRPGILLQFATVDSSPELQEQACSSILEAFKSAFNGQTSACGMDFTASQEGNNSMGLETPLIMI